MDIELSFTCSVLISTPLHFYVQSVKVQIKTILKLNSRLICKAFVTHEKLIGNYFNVNLIYQRATLGLSLNNVMSLQGRGLWTCDDWRIASTWKSVTTVGVGVKTRMKLRDIIYGPLHIYISTYHICISKTLR